MLSRILEVEVKDKTILVTGHGSQYSCEERLSYC
jgi:hypothetical protein